MNQVTIEKTEKYIILKIPIKSVNTGKALISTKSQSVVNKAIAEGLRDVELGQIFGPFKSLRGFKAALKKQ